MTLLLVLLAMIGLGLVISFSPLLLATEINLLTTHRAPRRSALILITGAFLPIIVLMTIGLLIYTPQNQTEIIDETATRSFSYLLNLIIGVVLTGYGSYLLLTTLKTDAKARQVTVVPGSEKVMTALKNPFVMFGFGFLRMTSTISSIAAVVVAVHLIKDRLSGPVEQLLAAMILITVSAAPYVMLLLIHRRRSSVFNRLKRYVSRLQRSYASLSGPVIIVVGLVFTVSALVLYVNS